MSESRIKRRKFLLIAGGVVGVSALTCAGLALAGGKKPEINFINTSYGEENEMQKKILVTYASRAGSTAGVADAIGKKLAASGAQVDVKKMDEVTDLSQYSAVVAGSAIHASKWLPEGLDFLRAHKTELGSKPFAAFMVCITLAMKNGDQYREGLKDWMQPVRSEVKTVSDGYFAGALDLSKLSGMDKISMGFAATLGVFPKGDSRDWKAIEGWAESILPLLG
jgi:menaquinone-dependent protoporphyrinogen oxidase